MSAKCRLSDILEPAVTAMVAPCRLRKHAVLQSYDVSITARVMPSSIRKCCSSLVFCAYCLLLITITLWVEGDDQHTYQSSGDASAHTGSTTFLREQSH